MMKGFVTKGIVLLAIAFLAYGCTTGGDEEKSVSSKDSAGMAAIPMKMDPASHKLTIGDGTGPATGTAFDYLGNGHSVEVTNGNSCSPTCIADGAGSKCWIRLINRDPSMYMANAFVLVSLCSSCAAGVGGNYQFDNADVINAYDAGFQDANGYPQPLNAYTVHTPATTGGAAQINTAGIAYVSDRFKQEFPSPPFNPFGANLIDLPTAPNAQPEFMISPACGVETAVWDFGGSASAPFGFWASVKASYYQFNAMGADNAKGGGDDDPRYDFTNFSTIYLVLTDLFADPAETTYAAQFKEGSVMRSHRLAGYGSSNATGVANIDYSNGQKYFAVNVGIEAADRIETMNHGYHLGSGAGGTKSSTQYYFEYYTNLFVILTYNPAIIQEINTGADNAYTFRGGASVYYQLAQAPTIDPALSGPTLATATKKFDTNQDLLLDNGSVTFGVSDRGGYILVPVTNPLFQPSRPWEYFRNTDTYSWWNGTGYTAVTTFAARAFPKVFNSHGFVKIRCNTMSAAPVDNRGCAQQDGADADVDIWGGIVYFKVNENLVANGLLGLGTEIKVDTFASYTEIQYDQSGASAAPVLGVTVGTYNNATVATNTANLGGCAPTTDDFGSFSVNGTGGMAGQMVIGLTNDVEQPNPAIKHRGWAKNGTYQAWNVAVCIQ